MIFYQNIQFENEILLEKSEDFRDRGVNKGALGRRGHMQHYIYLCYVTLCYVQCANNIATTPSNTIYYLLSISPPFRL